MQNFIPPLENLIEQFQRLPGIGNKTALRLAFSILNFTFEEAETFANAIVNAKKNIVYCRVCQNISDKELCSVCLDDNRDRTTVCVVEDAKAILSLEKVKEYNGLYHVLHGTISPMDGIGPEQLKIKELIDRIGTNEIKEVILATNPTIEGETTAMYITKILKPLSIKISRLAYGIPVGGDLDYADEVTLYRAIEGRREL